MLLVLVARHREQCVDSSRTINRRDFWRYSSAAALVGVVSLNGTTRPSLQGLSPGDRLECIDFENLVGEVFTVNERPAAFKLVHAQRSNRGTDSRPSHVRNEPFSLVFAAPEGAELESAVHRIQHPQLGSFEVFVNRIQFGSRHHGINYEVVFS